MLTEHNQKLKDKRLLRVAKVRAMREANMSVVAIAKKLKVSRQRVLQLLK